ncbi:hypothetical protein BFC18_08320 [Alteromonas confluentis]|uniref:Uncharacterized protein n=1 Tax=Alteromonas confluentis TaxID=1656094 RepID=A0A1E7ZD99_9ALTE|nr:hypothetical protein BFC18_08320 [Alteromonas confluentis]
MIANSPKKPKTGSARTGSNQNEPLKASENATGTRIKDIASNMVKGPKQTTVSIIISSLNKGLIGC